MLLDHLERVEIFDGEVRYWPMPPAEEATWQSNLELFEQTVNQSLRDRTIFRRQSSNSNGDRTALYPGSRVCLQYSPTVPATPRSCALSSASIVESEPDAQYLLLATASPASSPSPPPQQSRLLDLPQELQDIIFELAYRYPPAADFEYINGASWERREKARRKASGPSYQTLPFKHKVDDFIVSKAFFVGAAKQCVPTMSGILQKFFHKDVWGPTGIVGSYTTTVSGDALQLSDICDLLKVTLMKQGLKVFNFDDYKTGWVWRQAITVKEVRELHVCKMTMRFAELRRVEFCSAQAKEDRSESEVANWQEKIKIVEATSNEALEAKWKTAQEAQKDSLQGSSGPEPLYLGSAVYLEGSRPTEAVPSTLHEASSSVSAAPFTTSAKLQSADIPESVADLEKLLAEKGEAVIEWIQGAKVRDRHVALLVDAERTIGD
ncbi:hypothetical protein B0A55_01895 [Friedmanniomyces simplex]|uniref:Uncharacterized protein n=1 Tax=Friedmanniomyces simplex TaxID=329884 RepID=A0A4U0XVA8_9PEZI|nr:hypothetical protein B0A55_01895 [Friedmanniomyces simplex]